MLLCDQCQRGYQELIFNSNIPEIWNLAYSYLFETESFPLGTKSSHKYTLNYTKYFKIWSLDTRPYTLGAESSHKHTLIYTKDFRPRS